MVCSHDIVAAGNQLEGELNQFKEAKHRKELMGSLRPSEEKIAVVSPLPSSNINGFPFSFLTKHFFARGPFPPPHFPGCGGIKVHSIEGHSSSRDFLSFFSAL